MMRFERRRGNRRRLEMTERVRSQKRALYLRSQELRGGGRTWSEIGAIFRVELGVNARVALRVAHGWSQGDVADRWNARWPDDPKTFKNISYWEAWPAPTGYAPSIEVLSKLAELYECHVADLLSDTADHRNRDPAFRARSDLARLPDAVGDAGGHGGRRENATDDTRDALAEFISRLEECDVHELARQTAGWAAQLDSKIDRRSLLLKLSFGLTLAAATPPGAVYEPAVRVAADDEARNLAGVWRSEYTYYSNKRDQQFTGVHYVTIRQDGRTLTAESLPHTTGSRLALDLVVDGMTATGSWVESTSPTGYYQGAVYRGAMQLLVDPSGRQMTGRWIGFGKRFQINNGDWELTRETRSSSRRAMDEYALKA
jgi:hypothetical protein